MYVVLYVAGTISTCNCQITGSVQRQEVWLAEV